MKRVFFIAAGALVFTLTAPAFAGDHSCDVPVHECLNGMVTKLKTTGFIGVELDVKEGSKELVVSKVIPSSPAEAVGIQPGDVLVALNGIPFSEERHDEMAKVKVPGAEVTCTIRRNGASKNIKLKLVPMPADLMAKYIGEHMMAHAEKEKAETAAEPAAKPKN